MKDRETHRESNLANQRKKRAAERLAKFPDEHREMCQWCMEWFVRLQNHEPICTQRLLAKKVLR